MTKSSSRLPGREQRVGSKSNSIWAVVPAAGVGKRMLADIPKQYLPLAGSTVIENTLSRLLEIPGLAGIVIALGEEDGWWDTTRYAAHDKVHRVRGGTERADSVLNALRGLKARTDDDQWVLVHDAARPCVRLDDILRLIDHCISGNCGGILGMPVRDTMKLANNNGRISKTLPRENLWHAFTPQMFRVGMLADAIDGALGDGYFVTDEASAVEWAGHSPLLVEGSADNIKITRPEDLALAEFYLNHPR